MMNKRSFVLIATIVALVAQALPAKACTCEPPTRDAVVDADAAVIGEMIAQRDYETAGTPDGTVYTVRVDETFKGDFGETVDVYSDGSSCGLHMAPDDQAGLLLSLDDGGRFWSSSCQSMAPERLRELAAPLPPPDGRGPARLLAGGSWGEVGHLALDRRGRTLAYGLGNHRVADLEACTGPPLFAELYVSQSDWVLSLRRLRTNEVVWEALLPFGDEGYENESPVALGCRGRGDPEVRVASRPFSGGDGVGHILSYRDGDGSLVYEGGLDDAAFTRTRVAYVQRGKRGRDVYQVDLATGRSRFIGSTKAHPSDLAVSPDGTRLATFARDHVFVFDVDRRSKSKRELVRHVNGEVLWMGNDRVVFFPAGPNAYPVRFFDASLSDATVVRGPWYSLENAIVGRTIYGLGPRRLLRLRLPRGEVETVRRFESTIDVLEGLEGQVDPDWADS